MGFDSSASTVGHFCQSSVTRCLYMGLQTESRRTRHHQESFRTVAVSAHPSTHGRRSRIRIPRNLLIRSGAESGVRGPRINVMVGAWQMATSATEIANGLAGLV